MKCIKRLTCDDGITSKFIKHECDPPSETKPNEIIVKIKACGLSLIDYKVYNELFKKQIKKEYPVGQDVCGLVTQVGEGVTQIKVGDPVVGVLPLDSIYSGCGEYCVFQQYDVVKKPDNISFEEAAASIGDCVRSYTALFYHAKICVGDTMLIMDGASHAGSIAIQLAQHWGAKVLTTYCTQAEKRYLEKIQPPVAHMTEVSNKNNVLLSSVMEETGGLGVDCFIDNGVRMFTNEEDIKQYHENYKYPIPHKHDVLSCLSVFGKWVTSQPDLQLDPPDCQQLFLRGSSVCFLFDQAWIVTYSQQGRYQHVLKDCIKKLSDGILKCAITKLVTYEDAIETLNNLSDERVGKVVLKF
ncbi:quinone oxidoreductase-like protein 1 [Patella vulgata]|uniref:quinone oxidoreductase-like protein 1 n=1 Tax=Patella vulgata TaxID=6465 RepID=UPI0024A7E975|nr:quinone oxidoreductase-like protein 1 [Patella vulgata]